MPFTVIQAGTDLQFINTDGSLTTLDLYTGATLSGSTKPRWAVYNGLVVLVNTPNTPLTINQDGNVNPLTPKTPSLAPTIAAGDAGSLTGTYEGVRYSYVIRNTQGKLLAESDLSPASNAITISSKQLRVTGIQNSSESTVTGKRIYRPTTNGVVLFPWIEIDGNTITTAQDDLADSGLSLIAAPTLGSVPRLVLISEWRNRLWGVGDLDKDNLRFAQADAMWSWPEINAIPISGVGRDSFGIKSLIPRREALGVGRRDSIWQITGQTPDDFRAIKLSEAIGVESNETVVVYRDTVWWLWKDGVYQWDSDGLRNISDGKVKSWFSNEDTFNQGMFSNAFAIFDPIRLKYKLYLASAGSLQIDRWVEYDIQTQTWWGPHKTSAFTPSSAFLLADAEDKETAIVGSVSSYIWQEQSTATDDTANGISLHLTTKFFDGGLPDLEKAWNQLSVLGKVEPAGTLTVTGKVGYLDADTFDSISSDLTLGRDKLPRIGVGQLMQLDFAHSTEGESVELYGIEVPFSVIGRR